MTGQTKIVYRYEVPVDDKPHTFRLTCNPHAVAARRDGLSHVVEFWAEHTGDEHAIERTFRVYGTGQPIPAQARWWGTAGRVDGLVWHLFEVSAAQQSGEAS